MVFKISGTLGFHEKETLEKLFGECRKRNISHVVLDVERLTSLGGGCATIIRNEAAAGGVRIGVAAAKKTVLKFLQDTDQNTGIVTADSVEAAIAGVLASVAAASEVVEPDEVVVPDESTAEDGSSHPAPAPDDELVHPNGAPAAAAPVDPPKAPRPTVEVDMESDEALISEEVLEDVLGMAGEGTADTSPTPASAPSPKPHVEAEAAPAPERAEVPPPAAPSTEPGDDAKSRELKRRVVQYNTLLSINNDFARMHDRKGLLDAFLLTTIAQVGVESAVFLQRSQGYFYPAAMKGVDPEEIRGLALEEGRLGLDEWLPTRAVLALEDAPFDAEAKAALMLVGCHHVAPFIVHGTFRGIVLLGPPIRNELDPSTIDFLRILVNQAAIAYESTARVEEENERTLGVVRTLISLIEENTLGRGNTKLVSNYVYALAKKIHYPEEHLRDCMYGTVLRDIGMIKVSDLIVRSPRELMPEEWEVIKHHPSDGADMLRKMNFSDHAVNVVLCHHERFNGEGYPREVQGQAIPLGARIVSVVESYAAMLQLRPTRPALTQEEALNALRENWGMRYDPDVVKQFIDLVEDEIRSGETVANKRFELFSV
ncbi:MAG: HD domain-containing phosphohydrolase [Deltaproteobacteria bacterium]|nr:HD domain-containing phosphohydrolase [Deltaproteobacteria bacterium]